MAKTAKYCPASLQEEMFTGEGQTDCIVTNYPQIIITLLVFYLGLLIMSLQVIPK
jgi:hypothetical protein